MSRDSNTDRHFALLRLGKANSQRDEARKELEHERKQRAIANADYLAEAERCKEARAEVEEWKRRAARFECKAIGLGNDSERLREALTIAISRLYQLRPVGGRYTHGQLEAADAFISRLRAALTPAAAQTPASQPPSPGPTQSKPDRG